MGSSAMALRGAGDRSDRRAVDWPLRTGVVVSVLLHVAVALLLMRAGSGSPAAAAAEARRAELPSLFEERVRLGEPDSDAVSIAWLSAEDLPMPESPRESEVDQAALDPLAAKTNEMREPRPAMSGGAAAAAGGASLPVVTAAVPPSAAAQQSGGGAPASEAADVALQIEQQDVEREPVVAMEEPIEGPVIEEPTERMVEPTEEVAQADAPDAVSPDEAERDPTEAEEARERTEQAEVAEAEAEPREMAEQADRQTPVEDQPTVAEGEGAAQTPGAGNASSASQQPAPTDAAQNTGEGGQTQGQGTGASEAAPSVAGAPTLANPSDREAALAAIKQAPTVKWGAPTPAKGLRIRTKKPRLTHFTRLTAGRGDVVVRLYFDSRGTVRRHDLLQSSGSADVDREIITTCYEWRAEGDQLAALGSEQMLPVELKILR